MEGCMSYNIIYIVKEKLLDGIKKIVFIICIS